MPEVPEKVYNAFGEEVTDYDDENPYEVPEGERVDVDEGPESDALPAEGQETDMAEDQILELRKRPGAESE